MSWFEDKIEKYVPQYFVDIDEPELRGGILEYLDDEFELVELPVIKTKEIGSDGSTPTTECVPS